jgi:hypothetical protein
MQIDTDLLEHEVSGGWSSVSNYAYTPSSAVSVSPAFSSSYSYSAFTSPSPSPSSYSLASPAQPQTSLPLPLPLPLPTHAPAIPPTPQMGYPPLVSPAAAVSYFTFDNSVGPNASSSSSSSSSNKPNEKAAEMSSSTQQAGHAQYCSCGMHPIQVSSPSSSASSTASQVASASSSSAAASPSSSSVSKPQEPITYFNGMRWRRLPPFQNMYVSERGDRHVCDFGCAYKTWREDLNFFCCAISGQISRSYAHKKRPSEDDLVALAQQRLQRQHEQRFENGMAVDFGDGTATIEEEFPLAPLKKMC